MPESFARLSGPRGSFVFRLCRLGAVGLIAALLTGSAASGHSAEPLIAEVDKAFAAPAEPLAPPLLIFPVVGGDGRVIRDGSGLSYMATFAAVYTNRKLINLCPRLTQEVLADAGCTRADTLLDADTIRLCRHALGARLHAVPRLVPRGLDHELTITCHGDGGRYPDRTFTHHIKVGDRARIPGLIAQSVLEYLGVKLSATEREMVTAPQLRDEQDLRVLLDSESGVLPRGKDGEILLDLLQHNPRCVLGWELAITFHPSRVESMRRFRRLKPPLECPRLAIAVAIQVRDLGEPERALRMLLPFYASHRGDSYYQSTLSRCAMMLRDEQLARHVLELWRKADPSYIGCVLRGERLTSWAWDARGTGFADTVTVEGGDRFAERLQESQRELEKAVQLNPDGWTAHARLITVARGLGLPRDYMEEHFRQAVKLRPRSGLAYELKYYYLQPRWHGTPEEVLEFASQCVADGFWEERIPRLFPVALNDCITNPRDYGQTYALLREPQVWQAALAYYRSAMKGASSPDRLEALNYLVQWGILGEHYDEVVLACQKLRGSVREDIVSDFDNLVFLYDRVHAKTGKLMTQLMSGRKNDLALARTAVALAEGDCEQAAQWIDKVKPGPHLDRDQVACYRAAIAVGRKLSQDKSLDLKGAEGLEAFLGARPHWQYRDDQFVCRLPANSRAALTFPIGIRHGVITGSFQCPEGISTVDVVAHTRALRDPVTLRYYPPGKVQLIRRNVLLREEPLPNGPMRFRLTYDGEMDRLEWSPGRTWPARVYEDVASGFSLRFYAANRPVTITLTDLHLELGD